MCARAPHPRRGTRGTRAGRFAPPPGRTGPATPAGPAPPSVEPNLVEAPEQATHAMPAWKPTVKEVDAAAPAVAATARTVLAAALSLPPPYAPTRRAAIHSRGR